MQHGRQNAAYLRQHQHPDGGLRNVTFNGQHFVDQAAGDAGMLPGFDEAETEELLEVLVNTLQVREHQLGRRSPAALQARGTWPQADAPAHAARPSRCH